VVEAVAKGRDRLLLVMATGTGKTYTAFQIIWRLWRSGRKKRVLFLVDRNVLADYAMVNDFRPFGAAMAKLSTATKVIEREDGSEAEILTAIDLRRRIDTSYEIYLALYQAITGPDQKDKLFKELSRDFFDLIVVDECHRGSAADDSAWREILEYFSSATQIGMTATPKETKYVSNIHYFGPPIYSYSLKQGIDDGFLAPYKVIKVHIDRDIEGYRPEPGKLDKEGREVEDRLYNQKDFDRSLVIDERTTLVGERVSSSSGHQPLPEDDCVLRRHGARRPDAAGARQRQPRPLSGPTTVRDADHGQRQRRCRAARQLHRSEARFPVVVTTSQLLSTGVDAQTCRVIVLDREIGSMTEFKQIIGRATRIHEDTRKYFFTIIDFRKATNLFADPFECRLPLLGQGVIEVSNLPASRPRPAAPAPRLLDEAGAAQQRELACDLVRVGPVIVGAEPMSCPSSFETKKAEFLDVRPPVGPIAALFDGVHDNVTHVSAHGSLPSLAKQSVCQPVPRRSSPRRHALFVDPARRGRRAAPSTRDAPREEIHRPS
jgi:type I restriction enzyme, R subunit